RVDRVFLQQLDLAPEHAAARVDLGHGHVHRLHREFPERAEEAGARREVPHADDTRLAVADEGEARDAGGGAGERALDHGAAGNALGSGHALLPGFLDWIPASSRAAAY